MIFEQIEVGNMQNFSYIIADEESKEAAIVDAGWDIDKLVSIAAKEKLKITKIILTHSHYDHAQKADELASKTNAMIYFHKDSYNEIKKLIENPNAKIVKLKNNDEIKIGKIKIKVIHTPGHTPGAICLLVENKLITGDTLFVEGIGRVDLPGGNIEHMYKSLQKLKKLNDNTEVYPGHDYGSRTSSTIAYEKKNNPYMRASKEEFFRIR